ncbi:hypothetical protein MUTS15_49560 [Escherichia coli]|nr:hypothetical protein MUTS15_49560 [Escherichia coli]
MSKFAKTAIAAAMVMGAVVSSSAFAAGNNGTARFYGTIEDSRAPSFQTIINWKSIWAISVRLN